MTGLNACVCVCVCVCVYVCMARDIQVFVFYVCGFGCGWDWDGMEWDGMGCRERGFVVESVGGGFSSSVFGFDLGVREREG